MTHQVPYLRATVIGGLLAATAVALIAMMATPARGQSAQEWQRAQQVERETQVAPGRSRATGKPRFMIRKKHKRGGASRYAVKRPEVYAKIVQLRNPDAPIIPRTVRTVLIRTPFHNAFVERSNSLAQINAAPAGAALTAHAMALDASPAFPPPAVRPRWLTAAIVTGWIVLVVAVGGALAIKYPEGRTV